MSADLPLSLFVGGFSVFGIFLLAIRRFEGSCFAPVTIFALAYLSQSFVAPLGYKYLDPAVDWNYMHAATWYSLWCLAAVVAGYSVFNIFNTARSAPPRIMRFLNPNAVRFASVLVVLLLGLSILQIMLTGTLHQAKGAMAYGATGGWLQIGNAAQAVFPLLLAIYITASAPNQGAEALRRFVVVGFLVVLAISLVSFERLTSARLLLSLIVFHHFRVRRITARKWSVGLAVLLLLTAASTGRELQGGSLQVGLGRSAGFIVGNIVHEPGLVLLSLGSSIAGQEVFTNVLNIVPYSSGFEYGRTYVESAVSLVSPRIVTGNYDDIDTPTYWYKSAYAPDTQGHGFGFSMLAEAWLNFGPFMIILFFAIGIFLALLSRVIRLSSSPWAVILSITSLLALSFGLRDDSNGVFKQIVFYMVPVVLVHLWGKVLAGAPAPPSRVVPTNARSG